MQIIHEQFPQINRPFAVCIGKFDGLHIGHRRILDTLLDEARRHGALSVVYSFEPKNGPALTTAQEKEALLGAMGVDILVLAQLSADFMALEPADFICKLSGCGQLRAVVVGSNFRFGRGASGDGEVLRRLGGELSFDTHSIAQVESGGQVVSSTLIRECVKMGDVSRAAVLLGRDYSLTGPVARGRQIGRTIDFRTANIAPPEGKLIPAGGIYAVWADVDGKSYPAMTNIGTNPTVNGSDLVIESHLIGFEGDIYDHELTLRFVRRLRDEVRFSGIDELKNQLERDREDTLKTLVG